MNLAWRECQYCGVEFYGRREACLECRKAVQEGAVEVWGGLKPVRRKTKEEVLAMARRGQAKATKEQLEALLDEGLSSEQICERLGIHKVTLWRYVADWGLKDKAPCPDRTGSAGETVTAAALEPEKPPTVPVVRPQCMLDLSCTMRLNGDYTPQTASQALQEAASWIARLAGDNDLVRLDLVVFIERLRQWQK